MRYQMKSIDPRAALREPAAALGAQLARQEAELRARTHLLKHEIAHEIREGRDSAECSADHTAFGVTASVLKATGRTRRNIEDALQRLTSESFGVCLECNVRIPTARLQALPFADRCRDCQELSDAEERSATEEIFHRL